MPRYPQPGTVLLGKYRVTSLIGEGGMGVVIRARHIDLDEDVAIKCLLPEMLARPDIVQRFLREAKAAVKLKGVHVARVHDVGRLADEIPFIVMEYLEGADLNAILRHHGAQEPAVAADLMLQACEAIAEAHSLGIVHRDIKASNFFITQPENEAPILKVLDFGIATAPEGTSDLTSTQSVIGTPAYMSPEMMRSSKSSDPRSDIWSLGVVLYELLEGARPFRSEIYSELCLKVGMDPPIPITNPNVPEGLLAIVMKCLEKPLEKRYQSVAELSFDLMPFATDPSLARASVEQCARLLGRRATKMFDGAVQRTEDMTPAPHAPYRPNPANALTTVGDGSDATQRTPAALTPMGRSTGGQPSILGRPTPVPSSQPKTPTSIGGSSGEVAQLLASQADTKPRRRGLLIALTSVTLVAAGVIAMVVMNGQGGTTATASQPDVGNPTTTIKVEPTVEQPKTDPDPVKTNAADPVVKKEPVEVEVKKDPVEVKKDPVVVEVKKDPVEVKKDPVVKAVAVKKEPVKTVAVKKDPVKAVAVKDPVKAVAVKKEPVKTVAVKKDPVVKKKDPVVKKDPDPKKDPVVKDPKDEPGGELFKKRE